MMINTNTSIKGIWNILTWNIVHSTHPFVEAIKISHYGKEVIASPFKRIDIATESLSSNQDFNKIYSQNNYVNQYFIQCQNN